MTKVLLPGSFALGSANGTPVFPGLDMVTFMERLQEQTGGLDGDIEISAAQVTDGVLANERVSSANVSQHQGDIRLSASQITSGEIPSDQISEGSVTQHQGALVIAFEQVSAPAVNTESGAGYQLVSSDYLVVMTSASANTVTVPADRTGHFEIWQTGTGATTVQAAGGVTLNGSVGGSTAIGAQWGRVKGVRLGANAWAVS